jgi:hypothetical protein
MAVWNERNKNGKKMDERLKEGIVEFKRSV